MPEPESSLRARLAVMQTEELAHRREHAAELAEAMTHTQTRLERSALHFVLDRIVKPRLAEAHIHLRRFHPLRGSRPGVRGLEVAPEGLPLTAAIDYEVSFDDSDVAGALIRRVAFESEVISPLDVQTDLGIRFDPEALDPSELARFVDDTVLDFIARFTRHRRALEQEVSALVTDPVCGMQVDRFYAPAKTIYRDVTYYFCIPECRDRFRKHPETYLNGAYVEDLPNLSCERSKAESESQ